MRSTSQRGLSCWLEPCLRSITGTGVGPRLETVFGLDLVYPLPVSLRRTEKAVSASRLTALSVHLKHLGESSDGSAVAKLLQGSRVAERLGNWASNPKVAGSIPGHEKMTLCPWARHFTLLFSGERPCTYCKSLWIRASAK